MTFVITKLCQDCVDGDCLEVCPADCILQHKPSSNNSKLPNQLFIDPDDCLDCALCVPVCPWDAIYYDDDVPSVFQGDIELNALTVENPHEFVYPNISKSVKPSTDDIEANKRYWNLI